MEPLLGHCLYISSSDENYGDFPKVIKIIISHFPQKQNI